MCAGNIVHVDYSDHRKLSEGYILFVILCDLLATGLDTLPRAGGHDKIRHILGADFLRYWVAQ